MYEIESDVPLPHGNRLDLYPFADMKVGDSFRLESRARVVIVRSAITYFTMKTRSLFKFSVRKVEDNHYRCWRIK